MHRDCEHVLIHESSVQNKALPPHSLVKIILSFLRARKCVILKHVINIVVIDKDRVLQDSISVYDKTQRPLYSLKSITNRKPGFRTFF